MNSSDCDTFMGENFQMRKLSTIKNKHVKSIFVKLKQNRKWVNFGRTLEKITPV